MTTPRELIEEARAERQHCDHPRMSCEEIGCDYDLIWRLATALEIALVDAEMLDAVARKQWSIEYLSNAGGYVVRNAFGDIIGESEEDEGPGALRDAIRTARSAEEGQGDE